MDKLDIYYRAFKNYRDVTKDNKITINQRAEYKMLNPELNCFIVKKYLCKINSDWVQEIEEGLEYVEKAVNEERQFIRTNGEVVPIEKVKKISKDSVAHLSKHAELITHIPSDPNETIIPDEIYMVERLSDYAIYENRFLYLLLSYLRDFIELRIEKIDTIRKTYIAEFKMEKSLIEKNEYNFKIEFYDKRIDNQFVIPDYDNEEILARIEACQKIVTMLLKKDVMVQVSKSPMIKPPIVKTNVLKMNNNFKRALVLYDYITGYDGLGYEAIEVKKEFNPFNDKIDDEFLEIIAMTSFLTYKNGNEISELLDNRFKKEEERRRALENERLKERIIRLKNQLKEDNFSIDEYIILLEKRNKMLEADSEELKLIRNEVVILNEQIEALNNDKRELNRRIVELEEKIEIKIKEINDLNEMYLLKIDNLNQDFQKQIELNNELNLEKIVEAKRETAWEYEKKIGDAYQQLSDLRDIHLKENEEYIKNINELNSRINELNNRNSDAIYQYEQKLIELKDNIKNLEEELVFVKGSYNSLRASNGLLKPLDELTAKEKFIELENQYLAFNDFFKKQWKLTKKEIRRELLWNKKEKNK